MVEDSISILKNKPQLRGKFTATRHIGKDIGMSTVYSPTSGVNAGRVGLAKVVCWGINALQQATKDLWAQVGLTADNIKEIFYLPASILAAFFVLVLSGCVDHHWQTEVSTTQRDASLAYDSAGSAKTKTTETSPLKVTGLAYGTAQTVKWLDEQYFIVGRWDGTITVFAAPPSREGAPRLVAALATPSGEGVRLLLPADGETFVSSDSEDALMVWRKADSGHFLPTPVQYPVKHGFAVSGLFVVLEGEKYLITGHEKGDILVWSVSETTKLTLLRSIDLRMEMPIDYLHADEPLRHIRGLAMWKDGIVIAGGEDGGLHQVQLPEGKVLTQQLFNPRARLGINDLSVHGDNLLVVNCALDQSDSNLWLYGLKQGGFEHQDSTNLLKDQSRNHIFAFDVLTYVDYGEPLALVTTKEGLLWQVRFDQGRLRSHNLLTLGRFDYGNAIDYEKSSRRIASAGVGVRLIDFKNQ